MVKDEKYCAAVVAELAKATKTEMGPIMFRVYMQELGQWAALHGWDAIACGLEKCFLDLRQFPTVAGILGKLGIREPDKVDEANKIVADIFAAIPRIGGYRASRAQAELKSMAWEVVQRIGGWEYLCNTTEDEMGTLRAQMRDLAKAVLSFSSVGRLEEKMELPSGKVKEAIGMIEDSIEARHHEINGKINLLPTEIKKENIGVEQFAALRKEFAEAGRSRKAEKSGG